MTVATTSFSMQRPIDHRPVSSVRRESGPHEAQSGGQKMATVSSRRDAPEIVLDRALPAPSEPFFAPGPQESDILYMKCHKVVYTKLVEQGRFKEVLSPLKELLISGFGKDQELLMLYGRALAGTGRHEEACEHFAKCFGLSAAIDRDALLAWLASAQEVSAARSSATPR